MVTASSVGIGSVARARDSGLRSWAGLRRLAGRGNRSNESRSVSALAHAALAAACVLIFAAPRCSAQQSKALGLGDWFTFAANIPDAGYRQTQYFSPNYNVGLVEWDSRVEFWLPPSRKGFSWGPYVRFAGIAASKTAAFPNAWLSYPGTGFQMYPFSFHRFRSPDSKFGKVLGPVRFFAEYNRVHYWGAENTWRPKQQSRIGFEYWKAINVNETSRAFWLENWNGAYWQSSNEFTDQYHAIVLASSWRSGVRVPKKGALSTISPYIGLQTSHTKYDYNGACFLGYDQCDFYWENRLLVGGGLRFAPKLKASGWLQRFVIYGEYFTTARYYGPTAPSYISRFDVLIGISASIGQWYP
jgi:hypothetical protein